jgi:hypothetical protein
MFDPLGPVSLQRPGVLCVQQRVGNSACPEVPERGVHRPRPHAGCVSSSVVGTGLTALPDYTLEYVDSLRTRTTRTTS